MDTTKTSVALPKNIKEQLENFALDVKQLVPDAEVILFGSHSTGAQRHESDIDVCVVAEQLGIDYHAGTVKLLEIAHKFPIPMDVIPYTPEDLNNKYDPLAKEIRMHGVLIQ